MKGKNCLKIIIGHLLPPINGCKLHPNTISINLTNIISYLKIDYFLRCINLVIIINPFN